MSKERLKEIKELVKNVKKIESILYDEWRWQELTNLIESLYYAGHVDWLINRVGELEKQNERYREALTFYAEESNYDYDVKVDSIGYIGDQLEMKFYRLDSEILYDRGEKARKVLEGEN